MHSYHHMKEYKKKFGDEILLHEYNKIHIAYHGLLELVFLLVNSKKSGRRARSQFMHIKYSIIKIMNHLENSPL